VATRVRTPLSADHIAPYELVGEVGSRAVPAYVVRQAAQGTTRSQIMIAECFGGAARSNDPHAADLQRDARRMTTLTNPHLPRVREVNVRGDDLVVLSEFVDGEKLRTLWQFGDDKLPLELALRVLVDVLTGVSALHGLRDVRQQPLRVVHGEVSPATILLGLDGVTRLLHSVARRVPGARAEPESSAYLAPEVVSGEPFDARADVFSVGALLWEALDGNPLFPESGATVSALQESPVPLPSVPEKAPWAKALAQVATRALSASPDDRWPTAAAMAVEIRKASGLKLAPTSTAAAYAKRTFGDHAKARRTAFEGPTPVPEAAPGAPTPSPVASRVASPPEPPAAAPRVAAPPAPKPPVAPAPPVPLEPLVSAVTAPLPPPVLAPPALPVASRAPEPRPAALAPTPPPAVIAALPVHVLAEPPVLARPGPPPPPPRAPSIDDEVALESIPPSIVPTAPLPSVDASAPSPKFVAPPPPRLPTSLGPAVPPPASSHQPRRTPPVEAVTVDVPISIPPVRPELHSETSPSLARVAESAERRRRWSRVVIGAAAGLGGLLVVLAGWSMMHRASQPIARDEMSAAAPNVAATPAPVASSQGADEVVNDLQPSAPPPPALVTPPPAAQGAPPPPSPAPQPRRAGAPVAEPIAPAPARTPARASVPASPAPAPRAPAAPVARPKAHPKPSFDPNSL